uniref:Uncharacterized protein n=1 Tax=Arundo donax TaxID=35708 RepID=A0A0A9AA98_ARUDO
MTAAHGSTTLHPAVMAANPPSSPLQTSTRRAAGRTCGSRRPTRRAIRARSGSNDTGSTCSGDG